MKKTQKLYCYVDETGQDTVGGLFIVVVIVVGDDKHKLNSYLEGAEVTSGIGLKKWIRAKRESVVCKQYLKAANKRNFEGRIYYCTYLNAGTSTYERMTVATIARSIDFFVASPDPIIAYKVTINIDGLKGSEGLRIGVALRHLGIPTKKVHGVRDESEPLIRLADRVAGLIRDAKGGNRSYGAVVRRLEKEGILIML